MYWSLVQKLDGGIQRALTVEGNLHYSNGPVNIDYLYDPSLEGFGLASVYEAFIKHKPESPAILILAAGDTLVEQEPKTFAERTLRYSMASRGDAGLPVGGRHGLPSRFGEARTVFALPAHQLSEKYAAANMQPGAYGQVNAELARMAREKGIDVLWAYNEMKHRRGESRLSEDEFDVEVSRKLADVVLGLQCNAKLAAHGHFPNTRTCCIAWSGPNWVQISLLLLGLLVLPLSVLRDMWRPFMSDRTRPLLRAICAFGVMVCLQYITDRTHLFEQVQRMPMEMTNLQGMIVIILLVGALTVDSSDSSDTTASNKSSPDHSFMSRELTNEWKGWMQLLIIVYHYNKAWDAHWFWEAIRLAVSAYLFLTGFGHTLYFLNTGDYSLRRVAAVMVRINLLPVALAYVMHTRWLLYFYMPLTSFWFLVIYATLAFAPSYNASKPLLVGKILASSALVRAFIRTPDLDQTLVRLFEITCGISFDAANFFQYRVQIDEYIVYVGMLTAIFYVWASEALSSEDSQSSLARRFRRSFSTLKRLTILLAAVSLVSFCYYDHLRIHSEGDWSAIQPYMSFVPILSYVILRNAFPALRNTYSAAFAWLGRYSGEMYVMQDHLWLAGDQEAILRTGFFRRGNDTMLGDRWKDLLIITPLYLIACSIVGDATIVIAGWFVKDGSADQANVPQDPTAGAEVELGLLNGEGKTNGTLPHLEKKRDDVAPVPQRYRGFRGFKLWPETVQNRILVVLGVMWALNMTYT